MVPPRLWDGGWQWRVGQRARMRGGSIGSSGTTIGDHKVSRWRGYVEVGRWRRRPVASVEVASAVAGGATGGSIGEEEGGEQVGGVPTVVERGERERCVLGLWCTNLEVILSIEK